jgi:flagellar L-ring protein precursor FlgH
LSAKALLFLLGAGYACSLATPVMAQNHGAGMIDPTTYHGLAEDRRAHRVGDTLTVLVVETSSATAAANTGASNQVALAGGLRTSSHDHTGTLSLSGSDNGAGQTSRTGQVQAQLAVRVIGIDEEDTLRIHGEQSVVVNGENQRIALEGSVRPEDISATNTVLSNRISEAKIEFTGRGDVSAPQKRSIIYRFTKWLGLI